MLRCGNEFFPIFLHHLRLRLHYRRLTATVEKLKNLIRFHLLSCFANCSRAVRPPERYAVAYDMDIRRRLSFQNAQSRFRLFPQKLDLPLHHHEPWVSGKDRENEHVGNHLLQSPITHEVSILLGIESNRNKSLCDLKTYRNLQVDTTAKFLQLRNLPQNSYLLLVNLAKAVILNFRCCDE